MTSKNWLRANVTQGLVGIGLLLGAVTARAHEVGDLLVGDGTSAPPIVVLSSSPSAERGLIFVGPKVGDETLAQGPQIVDDEGRTIWFLPLPAGGQVADFRVQHFRGEPVLTWLEREMVDGVASMKAFVVDRSYRVIKTVLAGNGYPLDGHEFRITRKGTALILIYNRVPHDLTPVGGPVDSFVTEGMIQEVDIESGEVLFEWHSMEHVALDESYAAVPTLSGGVFDYLHVNAVNLDRDGNFLLSARNTSAVYKVSRSTGRVLWRMGGKQSDFEMGSDTAFGWQHDAHAVDSTTIRLFDNHAARATDTIPSRVVWLRRNSRDQTLSLLRAIEHPQGVMATSQGNAQGLRNGHTFVGWGNTGRFSEFDAKGRLVFDARVAEGYHTYRAYRLPWRGRPETLPIATAQRNHDGTTTVHAIWNGATEVADWYVVGGNRGCGLWPLGRGAWNGLDTTVAIDADVEEVAVVARDRWDRWLGKSRSVAVAPAAAAADPSADALP